jgi:hypothetical protein
MKELAPFVLCPYFPFTSKTTGLPEASSVHLTLQRYLLLFDNSNNLFRLCER